MIETLQTIALSVSPVVLGVEVSTLPPRRLHSLGGQLPASPSIIMKSIEILSDPEISRVAQKITEKDIPASDQLLRLAERHKVITGIPLNWYGTYNHAAQRVITRLKKERAWATV